MKEKLRNTRIVTAVAALALTVHSAHAAADISSAGADLTTNASWRTSSVIKPLDADGNNIYGSAGYFTSSWLANSLPSYATVGLAASMLTFPGNASYTRLDNAAGTATIQSGVHYRQVAGEMDFYIITLTTATSFRLGIITDNADIAAISPSDLRVRQTVGGTANSGLISAAADRDRDGDYYFFDITGGQSGDVFVVSGVNAAGNASNGLAEITFDTIPPPATITSFEAAGATGVINQGAKMIAVEVPFGTNLATLAPTFTLSSGTCNQTSGAVPSPNFATQNPVDYVVTDTATDPDTINTYSVTVTVDPEEPAAITSAGVDTTTNASWRTSSVIKPLDADGDNIYGSDGYFTSSWLANSLPSYATVGLAASILSYGGSAAYTKLDNAGGTATIQSGVHYRQPGAGVENDFYIITLTAATSFRLGIITDNADFAAVSPSDLRVRQTVGGTANSGLISAAADRDRDGDYYFFDITGGQIGDVFVVSGVKDGTDPLAPSNGLAGITFDTIDFTARITSFEAAGATGVIDQDAKTIALTVPFGTDLATLAPTFTLSSGTCNQTSGAVPSPNFATQNPVDYVVTDTSTDPDTVNTYSVTVTVAPETATLVIDLGTSPAGTMIAGGTFGSYTAAPGFPTNLPLPALPAGSILKSIAVNAVLESGDDSYASDLSLLLDPTPGTPGGDFSVEITNGPTPLGGAALDLNWPTNANAGPVTPLIDTKTDAAWAAAGPIDLATTGLFLGNAYNLTPGEGTWSGTITLTYEVGSGDATPPEWTSTWPKVDTQTTTGFTVRAKTDEDGMAYYVVLADGATAPSAAEVKAGTAAGGGSALANGDISLTANNENTAAVTGLTAGTDYDVYFVAQDAVPNLQASPVKVDVTTLTPYQDWAAGYGLTGGDALPTANPDGDLLTNLQEFAFGFNPAVSDGAGPHAISGGSITQNGPPQIYVDPVTGQYFLRYTRRTDYVAAGLTYLQEFAANSLDSFQNVAGGSVVATGTGAGGVALQAVAIEFPDALPVGGKKARFGRVGVTQAP